MVRVYYIMYSIFISITKDNVVLNKKRFFKKTIV